MPAPESAPHAGRHTMAGSLISLGIFYVVWAASSGGSSVHHDTRGLLHPHHLLRRTFLCGLHVSR
jgi:hypothetical protein